MLAGHTAAALIALLVGGSALAAPVTVAGLTFSDEEGGLVLRGGWGTGTDQDPITLLEDITGDGPAILVIRGMRQIFGNRVGTDHAVGFVLTKIVRNLTGRPWHSFELELREQKSRPSPYEDGLSFGQALGDRRRFGSDRFDQLSQTDEPIDAVVFAGTTIQPGETVQVRVLVTDYSPNWQFYLLQRRDAPLAGYAPHERVEAMR
ncbi:hypothetical protein SH611_16995 [Geminicoccaceae bacterium 1502E]|nr:hypothetical protein [Geminicoccaceae bacterium 1502E]